MCPRTLRSFLLSTCALVAWAGIALASDFEDALTSAYETNPRIKAERERLQSTDETVAQAASGFRPTVVATYDRGKQRTSFDDAAYSDGNYTNKILRVEQPLFRGGGTFSALNSARQRVKAGQADLASMEQQVLLDAVTAYMDVATGNAVLAVARSNADLLEQQFHSTETRFQAGEVTRTDLAQAQSRFADARANVSAAEGELNAASATFERIVGYKPTQVLAFPETLPELPATLDEALDLARRNNPQWISAVHMAKSSRYDVRTNESVLSPTVSLVGDISRQDGAGVLGTDKFNQDQIGVQMRIPLYQSGSEYARIRTAEAISRQRDHVTTDTRQAVEEAVARGWHDLATATQTIISRDQQIQAAQIAVEGAKQENQYGARTLLDLLDTEQELFNARTNLVRAHRDRIVAAYNLAFHIGQLTPGALNLKTTPYDPKEHAADVAWKPFGF